MPRYVLDVKAGMLEIVIQRRSFQLEGDSELFMPIMRRCYSLAAENGIWLNPGESLHNNINLAFGSAGFPLAERDTSSRPSSPCSTDIPIRSTPQGSVLTVKRSLPTHQSSRRCRRPTGETPTWC